MPIDESKTFYERAIVSVYHQYGTVVIAINSRRGCHQGTSDPVRSIAAQQVNRLCQRQVLGVDALCHVNGSTGVRLADGVADCGTRRDHTSTPGNVAAGFSADVSVPIDAEKASSDPPRATVRLCDQQAAVRWAEGGRVQCHANCDRPGLPIVQRK